MSRDYRQLTNQFPAPAETALPPDAVVPVVSKGRLTAPGTNGTDNDQKSQTYRFKVGAGPYKEEVYCFWEKELGNLIIF